MELDLLGLDREKTIKIIVLAMRLHLVPCKLCSKTYDR